MVDLSYLPLPGRDERLARRVNGLEDAMSLANRMIGVATGVAVLLWATSTFAQDWPQWRGPNRDGKVTGFTVPQTWPKTLSQKWKTTVGLGDATPALVGDKLYVAVRQGGNEVTLCLDAGTGKEPWRDKYAAVAVTGKAAWTDSVRRDRFGALLDAGSVILALPANSEFIAFQPTDKEYEELARIKVSDTPTYAHPVVAGNRVFIKDRDAVTLWTLD